MSIVTLSRHHAKHRRQPGTEQLLAACTVSRPDAGQAFLPAVEPSTSGMFDDCLALTEAESVPVRREIHQAPSRAREVLDELLADQETVRVIRDADVPPPPRTANVDVSGLVTDYHRNSYGPARPSAWATPFVAPPNLWAPPATAYTDPQPAKCCPCHHNPAPPQPTHEQRLAAIGLVYAATLPAVA